MSERIRKTDSTTDYDALARQHMAEMGVNANKMGQISKEQLDKRLKNLDATQEYTGAVRVVPR